MKNTVKVQEVFQDGPVCQASEAIVHIVMQRFEHLAENLEDIEERLAEKLQLVMHNEFPVEEKSKNEIEKNYPPLFDAMRSIMNRIERTTRGINILIMRTEL